MKRNSASSSSYATRSFWLTLSKHSPSATATTFCQPDSIASLAETTSA